MSIDKLDQRCSQWQEVGIKLNYYRNKGIVGSRRQMATDNTVHDSFWKWVGRIARITPGATSLYSKNLQNTIKNTESDIASLQSREALFPAEKRKLDRLVATMVATHEVLSPEEIKQLSPLETQIINLLELPDESLPDQARRTYGGIAPIETTNPEKNTRNSFEKDGTRWLKPEALRSDGKKQATDSMSFIQIADSSWTPGTLATIEDRMNHFKTALSSNFPESQTREILSWVNQSQLGSNALQENLLTNFGAKAFKGLASVEDHFDIREERGKVAIRATSLIEVKLKKNGTTTTQYHVVQNKIILDKDGKAVKKEEWFSAGYIDKSFATAMMRQVSPAAST